MNLSKIFYKYSILFLTIAFTLSCFGQKHPRELSKPADLNFKPPKPEQFELSNGIQVYYLENKELPLISINGLIKTGSLYEPSDKVGLAALTGTVLRTGGTKTLAGDQIDEELEFLAASIETGIGVEYGNINASCLKKDFNRVVVLLADILMNPEFRQDKIDLAKNQTKEGIRRRWDQPAQASGVLFSEKLYGLDNPLGRRSTPKSINNISRNDLIEFHKRYFAPNNFYIGITGDISLSEAKSILEKAFKEWDEKKVKFPEVQPLNEKADGTIYYAYKETPQANLYLGHLGISRNHPDEFKVDIMNYILGGGGFGARLMREIRSNRGLTYGIYGGVYTGRDKGVFRIASQLKADKCVEALGIIKDIIKDMQEKPVTDDEIEEAKNYLINSFVFKFEQKDRIIAQYLNLKLNGYPDNYFEKYIENIKKISKSDVLDAAKKYINTDKMILMIVGNEKKFDKPLSSFGKVVEIDLKKIIDEEKSEK
jgi:zinc protease